MKTVSMLNLAGEYELFADKVRKVVQEVLDSQYFINGPAVRELEEALSARVGCGHAIAVSNGTDAVLVSLMALGIGAGDEVLLPSFTFFATAGCVARLGAKPVFVEIDERTFNMDPQRISDALTDKTRAIIAVHLFGQCAQMDEINAIAATRNIPVIEDAAQAIGATYKGQQAGSLAHAATLSFYPTKNLGGFGEGGMVFTSDEPFAKLVRQLRNHGECERYIHEHVGGNFRLDTMKAAILLVKLEHFDDFTERRRRNAAMYDGLLQDTAVQAPHVDADCRPVYHQYSILTDQRDELRAFLAARGVASGIYYPIPLHLQACFSSLGYKPGSLPITEAASERILSLPCHPMLQEEDIRYVAQCIGEFHDTNRSRPTSAAQTA